MGDRPYGFCLEKMSNVKGYLTYSKYGIGSPDTVDSYLLETTEDFSESGEVIKVLIPEEFH